MMFKRNFFTKSLLVVTVATFLFTAMPETASARASHMKRSGKVRTQKTVRKTADKRNIKWDISIKKTIYKDQIATLRKQGIRIDNNRAMVNRLGRILNRLKRKSLIPNLPYEVHYVDHKTVNAVCYPGGGILFFKGLFNKKDGLVNPRSDSEIAAVMGHEIAHATLRHAYRKKNTATAVGILGSIASIAVGSAAGTDIGDLFDVVFDAGTGIYFPSYSRKFESESDLEGLFTMIAAKYNPEKAIAVWERAAKKRGNSKTSIYASHPSSGKRAKKLRKHLENMRASN